jgi:hypothetical protein
VTRLHIRRGCRRLLLFALLSLLFIAAGAGCGAPVHVAHVRSGPALMPKPASARIPVFFNETPGGPYREIAQIRLRSQGSSANLDEVLRAAVEDARELGADALIVELRAHHAALPVTFDCEGRPSVPTTNRLNARATAIIFAPGDRPEPTPTGPRPESGCASNAK